MWDELQGVLEIRSPRPVSRAPRFEAQNNFPPKRVIGSWDRYYL